MAQAETSGNGKNNLPGLYRHPESGAEVIVQANPGIGNSMADGAYQTGFRYVGPAPVETENEPEVAPKASVKK